MYKDYKNYFIDNYSSLNNNRYKMFENKESIIKYLAENTVLRSIGKNEIANFIDTGGIHFYSEGDQILIENDPGSTLYFVISGQIDILKHEESRDVYICTLGTGEFFGEAGLFRSMKRSASVAASSESSILKIERESFVDFIKTNPSSGIKILMLIIHSLLKKLKTVNQELAFERKLDIGQDDIDALINSLL